MAYTVGGGRTEGGLLGIQSIRKKAAAAAPKLPAAPQKKKDDGPRRNQSPKEPFLLLQTVQSFKNKMAIARG